MVTISALNGALPASMLAGIGGGFTLRPDAAASYLRARAAGAPAGVTTAYRTKAQQKVLLDLYGYPRAEYPGRSQHGEGVALDIPEPARSWFAAHGAAFGWVRTVMPSEPWHFEYVPGKDTRATPTIPTPEADMPLTQSDLEAIHRLIADTLDRRLMSPVPAIVAQPSLEAIHRLIADTLDARLSTLPGFTPAAPVTAAMVADEIARRLTA